MISGIFFQQFSLFWMTVDHSAKFGIKDSREFTFYTLNGIYSWDKHWDSNGKEEPGTGEQ